MLLALDTSTAAVTVAVSEDGHVLAESTIVDARRHTELVAPAIVDVLSEAGVRPSDLTAIVVGVGPGPFSGLRVGLMTARMLGSTLSVPVDGVCSLDVIAADVREEGSFVVVTDARRREVYWAAYDPGDRGDGSQAPQRAAGPAVVRPTEVVTDRPAAGAATRLYPAAFPNAAEPEYPSAGTLAAAVVAGTVEILPPDPMYLRRPDARPPGERKRVLAL